MEKKWLIEIGAGLLIVLLVFLVGVSSGTTLFSSKQTYSAPENVVSLPSTDVVQDDSPSVSEQVSTSENQITGNVVGAVCSSNSGCALTERCVNGRCSALTFQIGERKAISTGSNLVQANGFRSFLDDASNAGLWSGMITLSTGGLDKDYNAHETIDLGSGIQLSTSLDERNPLYGSKPFLKVPLGSLGYRFQLEQDLDARNVLTGASSSNPVSVPFLGKQLIINSATATSITALAGDRQTLRIGDTVQVNGITVTLQAVSSTSAYFDVGGQALTVTKGHTTQSAGPGIEIYLYDVFDSQQNVNDRAIVVISGVSTVVTYPTGSAFLDENPFNYLWEWNLAGLNSVDKRNITLGIKLHESLATPSSNPFPNSIMNLGLLKSNKGYLSQGDYLCLPYQYACLVFEGPYSPLTSNNPYSPLTSNNYVVSPAIVNLDTDGDGIIDVRNANVLKFQASVPQGVQGFVTKAGLSSLPNKDLKPSSTTLYFYYVANRGVQVYALKVANNLPTIVDLNNDGLTNARTDIINTGKILVARFNSANYNLAPIFVAYNSSSPMITFNIGGSDPSGILPSNPSYSPAGDLVFTVNINPVLNGINMIGDSVGADRNPYFMYLANGFNLAGVSPTVLRKDGVAVVNPKSNLENDKITLAVPTTREFKSWIKVAKPA